MFDMHFNRLVNIQIKEIKEKTIIHYPEVEDLCYREYSNHKNGCPNKHKCDWLNIPSFDILLDCGKFNHFYLVYAEFDFKIYLELRKKEHPKWSKQQLKNPLYWQNSVKKLLSRYIDNLSLIKTDYVLGCGSGLKLKQQKRVGSMENSCINVFSTCRLNDIKLEIHPKNKIYLVCLLCSKKSLILKTILDYVEL